LLGWSFGTEIALKYGRDLDIVGVILLSPPLRRTSQAELDTWATSGKRVVAIVPELDDFLRPAQAAVQFASVPQTEFVAVENGKHLWVGEVQTSRVLNEIVSRVNPSAAPLPTVWG
jgi:alpha/beta superfamily hydrolase